MIPNTEEKKQKEYNTKNNKKPEALNKSLNNVLAKNSVSTYSKELEQQKALNSITKFKSTEDFEKAIRNTRKNMEKAAKELDFIEAALLRDQIKVLQLEKSKM